MSVMVFLGTWQVLQESWRFITKKKHQKNPKTNKQQPDVGDQVEN